MIPSRNLMLTVAALALFLLGVTHVAALSLLMESFDPGQALFTGTCLAVGLFLVLGKVGAWPGASASSGADGRMRRDLLFLLALALVFRFSPLPDHVGGRDDGTYSNMAAHLSRSGSVTHTDPTLESVPRDGRAFYGSLEGIRPIGIFPPGDAFMEDRWEGTYLPGIYVTDADNLQLVFQFPASHPAWMAVAARIFGLERMNFSVIMFGLLSVLVTYLLVAAVTGSRHAALWAGVLLACNPLHAYFSRKSLSEPQALFFLLLALLMLVWAWRLADSFRSRLLFVLLAVASYSGFCLTRIDGFFLLPFAILASVYLVVVHDERPVRNFVYLALGSVLLTYLASAWYLHEVTFPYFYAQMSRIFLPLLGDNWWPGMIGLGWGTLVGGMAFLLLVDRVEVVRRSLRRLTPGLYPLLAVVLLAAVGYHALKVVRLAEGSATSMVGYVEAFQLGGKGTRSISFSSLVNLMVYLSPAVLVLFFWRILSWRRGSDGQDHLRVLGLLLVSGYFLYVAVFQWVLPFQYYYGRYLLAGILPLMLIFTLADLGRTTGPRKLATGLLVLGLVWSVALSSTQFRFRHADQFLTGLAEIVKDVDHGDLILWDRSTLETTPYEVPLAYTFDRNIWTFDGRAQLDALLQRDDVLAGFADIHVFTTLNYFPRRMSLADDFRITWDTPRPSDLAPTSRQTHHLACSRFLVNKSRADGREKVFFDRGKGSVYELSGFHSGLGWSRGHVEMLFDLSSTGYGQMEIRLTGSRPGGAVEAAEGLTATLNGAPLTLKSAAGQQMLFDLPGEILKLTANRLVLEVPTFVPAERNPGSRDTRELGLDLHTISFR